MSEDYQTLVNNIQNQLTLFRNPSSHYPHTSQNLPTIPPLLFLPQTHQFLIQIRLLLLIKSALTAKKKKRPIEFSIIK